jgi:translation initiation factor 6 (eIF-6)
VHRKNFDGGIIWCKCQRTAIPTEQLTVLGNNIRFNERVPEIFDKFQGRACLIILEDLLNEVYSKEVCNIFTKGSQHRKIGVILITQKLFHKDGSIGIFYKMPII